jgi:hypothetical protein
MLNNSRCRDFIANLLNTVAGLTGDPAISTNPLALFDSVRGQRGFIYGDTIRRTYGFDGATAHGSITRGDAQVELPFPTPFRSYGQVNQRAAADYAETQARIQAMSTLHELFHLAGRRGGYSDYDLAKAVATMRGVAVPNFPHVRRASEYWSAALEAACKPR